jgi:hypothetical protein
VYLRALGCNFVNFDDQDFVLNNSAIRHLDWDLFSWAFTTPGDLWAPLTYVSFAIDYFFWELNPFGYHLTNILLHSVNTALVVLIADRIYQFLPLSEELLAKKRYLYPGILVLSGLLFGIHPLRVESVAWVSERKDVLNGVFTFASVYFYLCYALKKRSGSSASGAYLFSLTLFVFSLMAKPISVTIPVLLLVADWYPLDRLKRGRLLAVLVEKLPYFAASAAVSIGMIVVSVKSGHLLTVNEFPPGLRFIVSGNAVFEYARLLFLPYGISPQYIIPSPVPMSYTVKTVVVIMASLIIISFARKNREILAAWLCFIIPLVPILAFFQANPMAFAAHCTYLPAVVPTLAAGALIARLFVNSAAFTGRKITLWAICPVLAILVCYGVLTQRQIEVWKDSAALWTRVIEIQPFDRAFFSRGMYYADSGRYQAAIDDYTNCLQIMTEQRNPEIFNLFAFRGEAYARAGRLEEAVNDFSMAISMKPHPLFYLHRGQALTRLGRGPEAAQDMRLAGRAKGQVLWINPWE